MGSISRGIGVFDDGIFRMSWIFEDDEEDEDSSTLVTVGLMSLSGAMMS